MVNIFGQFFSLKLFFSAKYFRGQLFWIKIFGSIFSASFFSQFVRDQLFSTKFFGSLFSAKLFSEPTFCDQNVWVKIFCQSFSRPTVLANFFGKTFWDNFLRPIFSGLKFWSIFSRTVDSIHFLRPNCLDQFCSTNFFRNQLLLAIFFRGKNFWVTCSCDV